MTVRTEVPNLIEALLQSMRWQWQGSEQGWAVTGQRLVVWGDVQQPAAFVIGHDEIHGQRTNMPYRRQMMYKIVIYHDVARDSSVVGDELNRVILDELERVLAPAPTDPGYPAERNTLGGLVHHLWIDGQLFKDGGDLDGQAVMVVPISVLVP